MYSNIYLVQRRTYWYLMCNKITFPEPIFFVHLSVTLFANPRWSWRISNAETFNKTIYFNDVHSNDKLEVNALFEHVIVVFRKHIFSAFKYLLNIKYTKSQKIIMIYIVFNHFVSEKIKMKNTRNINTVFSCTFSFWSPGIVKTPNSKINLST